MSSSATAWWQRALGQRLNAGGVASFVSVAVHHPELALPHIAVPDIRWVDWSELRRLGFRGVVFDKDNTLTAPYSLSLWPAISRSLQLCRDAFPGKVAVFSNSAGLRQYDPDGTEATLLEQAIGVHVIRHETKKPTGTAEDIEKFFDCSSSRLVMVGDRYFTDIVYGNRHGFLTILTEPLSLSGEPFIVGDRYFTDIVYGNRHGFLTILTEPLSLSGEPFIVKQVRKVEKFLVSRWYEKGLKPAKHELLSVPKQCVKFSP